MSGTVKRYMHGVLHVPHILAAPGVQGGHRLDSSAGLNIVCSYAEIVQLKFRNVQSNIKTEKLCIVSC